MFLGRVKKGGGMLGLPSLSFCVHVSECPVYSQGAYPDIILGAGHAPIVRARPENTIR